MNRPLGPLSKCAHVLLHRLGDVRYVRRRCPWLCVGFGSFPVTIHWPCLTADVKHPPAIFAVYGLCVEEGGEWCMNSTVYARVAWLAGYNEKLHHVHNLSPVPSGTAHAQSVHICYIPVLDKRFHRNVFQLDIETLDILQFAFHYKSNADIHYEYSMAGPLYNT